MSLSCLHSQRVSEGELENKHQGEATDLYDPKNLKGSLGLKRWVKSRTSPERLLQNRLDDQETKGSSGVFINPD